MSDNIAREFLAALQSDNIAHAFAMWQSQPWLSSFSIHTAAACANVDAVATFLESDPAAARAASTFTNELTRVEPIIYASHGALASRIGISDTDRIRTIQLLLDAGASPNAFVPLDEDPHARIPALYFACVSNNVAVAKLLLERGANPNDGESVYHAAEYDHRDCLQLLLAHGADVGTAHAHWGNTPLYFLAGYGPHHPRAASVLRGMEWLLDHSADPNVVSRSGTQADGTEGPAEVPLHRAAASGRVDMVELLLAHGANIDVTRADGKTPYVLAERAGRHDAADLLRSRGADVSNLSTIDMFIKALLHADEPAARTLLAAHADLMLSLTANDRQAIDAAIEGNRPQSVRLMLDVGWSVTDESPWGGTPLHWASWFGRPAVLELLLERGAPLNVRDSLYGSSPIAWAAHGSTNSRPGSVADYLAVVDRLIDAGAARAESFNKWNEAPESMASPAVAQRLHDRGFTHV